MSFSASTCNVSFSLTLQCQVKIVAGKFIIYISKILSRGARTAQEVIATIHVLHAWKCCFRLFDFFLSTSSKDQFIQSHFHLQRPNGVFPQNTKFVCACTCIHNFRSVTSPLQTLQTMQKNFQKSLSKARSPQVTMWGQFCQTNGPDASGEGRNALGHIDGISVDFPCFGGFYFSFFPDLSILFRLAGESDVALFPCLLENKIYLRAEAHIWVLSSQGISEGIKQC